MERIILKIGGSVITEKDHHPPEINGAAMTRIAQEIKKSQSRKEFQLIVVHGAGSFGHQLVTHYNINEGVQTDEQVKGFVETHASVSQLNFRFVNILKENQLLAFPIHPSSCVVQENKSLKTFDTYIIQQLLQLHPSIIPVLYGDMVIDTKLGASVVSGDALAPFLAEALSADRLLLGTDVGGIFTTDPNKDESSATLIPEINNENYDRVLTEVGTSSTVDVTEGMKGKLKKLRELLKARKAIIFDLTQSSNLQQLLLDDPAVPGTRIQWS